MSEHNLGRTLRGFSFYKKINNKVKTLHLDTKL